MDETIARCREDGLATYDLLAPAQDYKRAIATGAVAVRDYAVALDLRGHAALAAARLTPTAKSVFDMLPLGWRREIVRRLGRSPGNSGKA